MEAVSLGISIVSIIGIFDSCVNLYGDILSIRHRDEDVQATYLLVQIERHVFQRLQENLLGQVGGPESSTITPQTSLLCNNILQWMQADLKRILDLCAQYAPPPKALSDRASFQSTTEDGSNSNSTTIPAISPFLEIRPSSSPSKSPQRHSERSTLGLSSFFSRKESSSAKSSSSFSESIKKVTNTIDWIASDKQRLKDLASRIHQWNEGLGALVPEATRQKIAYETVSNSIASDVEVQLGDVEQAVLEHYPAISQSAGVKRLTIRSYNMQLNTNYSLQEKSRFKLAAESLQWLSSTGKSPRTPPITSSYSGNLANACTLERAFARLSLNQQTGAFIVNDVPGTDTDSTPVIVEWRDSFRSEESLKQFEYRLDYLVTILRRMSGGDNDNNKQQQREGRDTTNVPNFGIFPCLGWITTSPTFDRIGLVFSLASACNCEGGMPALLSLNDLIIYYRRKKQQAPSLGQRFALAHRLASTLATLSSVGWVHKEFRSHNVILVPNEHRVDDTSTAKTILYDLERPYLSGFTYARPPSSADRDLSQLTSNPEYDLYRPNQHVPLQRQERRTFAPPSSKPDEDKHPNIETPLRNTSSYTTGRGVTVPSSRREIQDLDLRISRPTTAVATTPTTPLNTLPRWTPAMDIYGLGIVLVEIALWRTIHSLKGDQMTRTEFVDRILPGLVDSLNSRVGALYLGVVKRCLGLGDWVDNDLHVRDFFADAIEKLSTCRA